MGDKLRHTTTAALDARGIRYTLAFWRAAMGKYHDEDDAAALIASTGQPVWTRGSP